MITGLDGLMDHVDRRVAEALDRKGDAIVRNIQGRAVLVSRAIPPAIKKTGAGVDTRGPFVSVRLDRHLGRGFLGSFFEDGTVNRFTTTWRGSRLASPAARGRVAAQPFFTPGYEAELARPLDLRL